MEYKSDDKKNAGGQSGAGFFGDGGAQTSSDSLSPSSGVPISAGELAREMLVWLLGMLLSAAMVFFRDVQFLWGVLTTIWMYLTPIFYPVSALPEAAQRIVMMNPLYYYVTFVRTCIIDGVSPEPVMYAQCLLYAIAALVVGAWVFKKNQDKFVLYL